MTTRTASVSKTRQDRVPFDAYLTPRQLALTLCRWLKEKGVEPERILEPSAGHGDFVWAARQMWPNALIFANEIQERLVERTEMRNYLLAVARAKKDKAEPPAPPVATLDTNKVLHEAGANVTSTNDFLQYHSGFKFNLIVGNPPYTLGGGAEAHVARGLELLEPGGVLGHILKMHFRGTEARIGFWREHPFAADPPIVPRPDFTGDGRDTVEYTFYCWHRAMEPGKEWRLHCPPAIEWRLK